jgi:hypothetical protein
MAAKMYLDSATVSAAVYPRYCAIFQNAPRVEFAMSCPEAIFRGTKIVGNVSQMSQSRLKSRKNWNIDQNN